MARAATPGPNKDAIHAVFTAAERREYERLYRKRLKLRAEVRKLQVAQRKIYFFARRRAERMANAARAAALLSEMTTANSGQ